MTYDPQNQRRSVPPQNAWGPRQPPPPQWQPQQPPPQQPQYPVPVTHGQQYQPQAYYLPRQPSVQPRSPGLALLISLFLPGIGTMYGGWKTGGLIIAVLAVLSLPAMIIVIGFITLPLCWIAGLITSFEAVQSWNRKHGIIS